uniref:TSC22 domain family protein 2 n=1 Tax=Gouania willdenowi TaxID=441366 RepID=A0A8C5EB81_GOUWI
MSKMPAKKKSCFQITSVTQAQVAANSIADGTQSLDDPDVSRAEIGGCDTLNNVGDPHEGIVNGGLCGSRFRVIKLDHGTGEPFRRGRWSCTEFYEKDSESNVSRTVDTSIKPAAATFDPSTERDSGLGANNGNSVVTSSAFSIQVSENSADSGYSVSAEAQHQGYSLPPQIGSGASAFQPAGFMSALQQAQVSVHPAGPQTFLTNSLNGMHQVAMSPIIAAVTQPQQLGYSTQAHTDYHQHHFGSSIQNPPMASLTVGSPPANQMPSPAITPGAAPGVQGLNGDAAQPHILQVGNSPAVTPVPGIVQHQPSGGSSITTASSISAITAQSGSQSVPAKVPSTSSPPTGLLSQVPAH